MVDEPTDGVANVYGVNDLITEKKVKYKVTEVLSGKKE
jgi:hypothetical protein